MNNLFLKSQSNVHVIKVGDRKGSEEPELARPPSWTRFPPEPHSCAAGTHTLTQQDQRHKNSAKTQPFMLKALHVCMTSSASAASAPTSGSFLKN